MKKSKMGEGARKRWLKYYTKHKKKMNKKTQKWQKKNPEKIKVIAARYRKKNFAWRLCYYRRRDEKKGLKFDLTLEWIKENIEGHVCVYCGSKENVGCDRKDNSKGHSTDNCVPCCRDCNRTRGDRYSYELMLKIGEVIKQDREKNVDANRTC